MSMAVSAITAVMLVVCVSVAVSRLFGIWKLINVGRAETLTANPGERIGQVIKLVFGQKKVVEDRTAGSMHFIFLYGFLALGIGHTELVFTGLTYFLKDRGTTPFFYSNFLPEQLTHVYHFSQDFLAFIVILACAFALIRRFSGRIKRLMPRSLDAEIILWLIMMLYVSFFLLWGTDFAMRMQSQHHLGFLHSEGVVWWAFASTWLGANVFGGMSHGTLEVLHWVGYFMHLSIFLGFAVYITYSKHMHLVWAGPNIYFHKEGPRGLPPPINFMDETVEKYGVDRITEFSWKTMLDTFACTECGRCDAVCPAHITGKPLKPKKVLHDLKDNLWHKNGHLLKGKKNADTADIEFATPLLMRDEVDRTDKTQVNEYGHYLKEQGQIHLDTLWACTTCAACVEVCPVLIDSVPGSLIALRQTMVMMEADFPAELTASFNGMERQGNPWGQGQDKREDWLSEGEARTMGALEDKENVEYLYWVGCAGATDDNAQKTQKSLVKILKKSGVDFAIMGCGEKCTGDPARRMGNEYLFDTLARENVGNLNALQESGKFKKIFTACPHCFNSLKNEYPDLGGNYEVHHHTQLLSELVRDKKLDLSKLEKKAETVTYHDPCYLGRYNEVFDEPREVLRQIPGVSLKEMELSGRKSMCCGAGGGRVFMEDHIGKRIENTRTLQANETGAETIAVGCPFCTIMISTGLKGEDLEEKMRVRDIAQMIAERMPDAP